MRTTTLTEDQRWLLLAVGGWPMVWCLADPDTGIPHLMQSRHGSSGPRGDEWPQWVSGGLECGGGKIVSPWLSQTAPRCVVTTSELARFAKSLPPELVAQLRDVRRASTRHAIGSHEWCRCGREACERQHPTDEEVEANRAEFHTIRDTEDRLLREALGVGAAPERAPCPSSAAAEYYHDDQLTLHHGDALEVARTLPDGSIDCIVTSPPYFGLRDYGHPGQYGLEASPAEYVETMRALFAELRRALADDGTLWLNLGDSFSTRARGNDNGWDKSRLSNPGRVQKMQRAAMREREFDRAPKSLLGIPWRVAFALQDDGWILRNDIIWAKANGMPESITDRLSKKHEHVFLMTKSPRYYFNLDAIRVTYDGDRDPSRRARTGATNKPNSIAQPWEPTGRPAATPPGTRPQSNTGPTGQRHTSANERGRNPGDVWTFPTQPYPGAHFATMPPALAERCVVAGCKPGGTVLDPFSGSGTTGWAAARHGRRYVGIDLSAEYLDLSLRDRLSAATLDFSTAEGIL